MKKRPCDEIFSEFASRWRVTEDAARLVFILVDLNRRYRHASRTLASMGMDVSPRALRYFYRKIVLTDYYGTKKKLGGRNYKWLVLRRL